MKKETLHGDSEFSLDDSSRRKVKRKADIVDVLIGLQVRKIRKELKLTQQKVSEALNISYQQVQKYERGENRIAASTLLYIALTLNKPIEELYKLASEYLEE